MILSAFLGNVGEWEGLEAMFEWSVNDFVFFYSLKFVIFSRGCDWNCVFLSGLFRNASVCERLDFDMFFVM